MCGVRVCVKELFPTRCAPRPPPPLAPVAATFSAAIDSDNLVTMTFSEAVHRSGGGEPVSSSFNVTVDPPLDVAVVAVTAQSTSVFILNVTFSGGVPSGTQHVSVDVVPSAILTTSSNLAVGAAPARLLLHERVPPSFVASVGAGNVVAVNFTEDVSSPDGALVASDLLPALVGGSATLLSWNLTTLSPRDYALTLLLLGQANGSEVVTVAPVPGRVCTAYPEMCHSLATGRPFRFTVYAFSFLLLCVCARCWMQ